MKNILLILALLFSLHSFAQKEHPNKFEYSANGLNDYILTEIDGFTASDIYAKVINWVKETYKNPDIVLKFKIENEKIRINGSEALLYIKGKYSMNLDYVYEIAFKDGRYKFDLISLKYEETDYKNLPNFKTDKKMIKNFGDSPQIIEDFFNNLNNSIKEYITVDSDNDDW